MIGAAVPASVLVLDIDPRNGGSFESLVDRVGDLPETLTVWSGRDDGGRHLYYRQPLGELTSPRLPKGVDLKMNGYCIVPPSIHPASGLPYRWDGYEAAELPPTAAAALRHVQRMPLGRPLAPRGDGSHLIRWLDNFPVQGINNALYWATRRADEDGTLDRIEEGLVQKAVALGESEPAARRTVESARSCPNPRLGGTR
jgi:hypothetical protein